MSKNKYVIGIDLGTRNSCVGIWRNKRFEIIPDQYGNRTMPSIVSFHGLYKTVGANALAMKDISPKNTIYDIKRIIGRKYDDEQIINTKKLLTYDISDNDNNIAIELENTVLRKKTYYPEEICSFILAEIKKNATNYLKSDVSDAVITVPGYFSDLQRQATLDAARIAGLNVIKIINEPTAAALAYGLGSKEWKNCTGGNVIVYDLGAGTLDVSLINIKNGMFKVLAVTGNSHLGGEDFDYVIMNHVINDFKRKNHIENLEISPLSKLKLKNSVENAKKMLSSVVSSIICVDDFYKENKLYYVLTREKFELICNELFLMCIQSLNDVLQSASFDIHKIDDVIICGGSTRILKIQELILNFFKGTKINHLICSLNPDEVVSAGASIYGYIITNNDDPFTENINLLDIVPLSLGVEILQKQMSVVIPRNSVIPTKKTKIYSTDTDEQSSIIIKIYEGERKLTKHNVHIANFELSGFHKGPKGNPRINITFHVDINGILQVTAHEKRSGVENSIKITSSNSAKGRLSQNEIEQLINEAQMNEEFDSLYVMKLNLNHQISNNCTLILSNINNEMCTIPTAEKKKIKSEIKKIQKQLLDDLSIDELKNISEKIHKNYTSYIIQINKENSEFKCNTTNVGSHIHDNDDVETYKYDAIVIPNDASDYEVEEIKTLKKSISNLCNDIKSIITNPVSKFIEDDIMLMSDYIDSVQIWLFTTNAKATKDFVVKMNEVHQFTEEIMKKYENKEIFEINEKFTQKDELEMVCCTINNSIKENYFLLNTSDMEKLVTKITDTMKWIHDYPNEHEDIYINKKIEIKNLCNEVYNNMNSNTTISTETETDSDDDDNEPEKVQICNMNKNIDKLIDNLPTMISRQPKEKDVLLKINIDLDDIKFK